MKLFRIRFPSGAVGGEIRYYMGEGWSHEKDELGRELLKKCKPGKDVRLNPEELKRLAYEVDLAAGITADNVENGPGEPWRGQEQANLLKFSGKLNAAI